MTAPNLDKVASFLDCVEKHFVTTAQSDGVAVSCTATCLLLFSAADAIGSAFSPPNKPTNRQRFEWTFSELGDMYSSRLSELWVLRNDLMHEALNASAFLSQVQEWGHDHLDLTRDRKLLLNTRQLTNDLAQLVRRLKSDVEKSTPQAIAANDRLEWSEGLIDQRSLTTPPPPIRFRYLKRR